MKCDLMGVSSKYMTEVNHVDMDMMNTDPTSKNWRQDQAPMNQTCLDVLTAVQQNGVLLQHVADNFKDDRIIALAAVKQTGHALLFASQGLKTIVKLC